MIKRKLKNVQLLRRKSRKCLFCLKQVTPTYQSRMNGNVERILRTISRIVEINQNNLLTEKEGADPKLCGECYKIGNDILEKHTQLKVLELRINGKLEELRIKASTSADGKDNEGEKYQKELQFRENFILNCGDRAQKSLPQLLLHRVKPQDRTSCGVERLPEKRRLISVKIVEKRLRRSQRKLVNKDSEAKNPISTSLENVSEQSAVVIKSENYHGNNGVNDEDDSEDNDSIASAVSFEGKLSPGSSTSSSADDATADGGLEGGEINRKGSTVASRILDKEPSNGKSTPAKVPETEHSPDLESGTAKNGDNSENEKGENYRDPKYLTPEQEGVCEICSTDCGSRLALQKHKVVVHKVHTYVHCPACGICYSSRVMLKKHLLDRKYRFACGQIQKITPEVAKSVGEEISLRFPHRRQYGHFFCTEKDCFEVFFTEADRIIHLRTHGSWTCPVASCPETFSKAHELAFHEAKCHVSELTSRGRKRKKRLTSGFNCPRCTYSHGELCRYLIHFLRHHLNLEIDKFEKGLKCPVCSKSFPINHGPLLQRHIRTVHREATGKKKPLNCKICPATFWELQNLNRHLRSVHKIDESFHCPDCKKTFRRFKNLKHHIKYVHNGAFHLLAPYCNFECPICKETFTKDVYLKKHVQIRHTTGKSLTCSNCKKKFDRQVDLNQHRRNVCKTFKCDKCGKSHQDKYKLAVHHRIHEDPETFQFGCSWEGCGRRFYMKSKLVLHMRSHTNEKPFVCDTCGKGYAHSHNLRIHLNNSHGHNIPVKKYTRTEKSTKRGQDQDTDSDTSTDDDE